METIKPFDKEVFRNNIEDFKEKTDAFYAGNMNMKEYKGFSGKFGSYAQRGGKSSMLRLRMSAGRMPKAKLDFIIDQLEDQGVDKIHFTTCQAVQLHNLQPNQVYDIMDKAIDADIITYGGGGDYPRNVMCSPLSGTEADEYFDVMPYALAASDFLMQFIDAKKLPRKLKVAFSNSKKNEPHATFRDLGFTARENGNFDVWAAGGLGVNPRLGVLVAEDVKPEDILYYILAMIMTFRKYGNYEQRTKARTRFMVEAVGGEEAFRKAFQEELKDVMETYDLKLKEVPDLATDKTGDGTVLEESFLVTPQKQEGLYSVRWHPIGGSPKKETLIALAKAMDDMKDVELRIAPDETAWIINLNGTEAKKVLEIIEEDAAHNEFETSTACIGASICQVGVRDSQAMLQDILKAVKEAGIPANALPKFHISGCPSSCGTHQAGVIGLRGGVKLVDKKPAPAFSLFLEGEDEQGKEKLGLEQGMIAIPEIPKFVVELGKAVAESGMDFEAWKEANPQGILEIAKPYLA